jgi:UDP-N-acetylglucosamine enolpyruvyl transferase
MIPDQIETGTFMVAAAITKGAVTLRNTATRALKSIIVKNFNQTKGKRSQEMYSLKNRKDRDGNPRSFPFKKREYRLQQVIITFSKSG